MPLDPQWRCFFDDGSRPRPAGQRRSHGGRDRRTFAGPSADGFRQFMRLSQRLHEISERFFFWKAVGGILDTFDLSRNVNPATLSDVMSLRMGKTVAGRCDGASRSAVAQMLDHFASMSVPRPRVAGGAVRHRAHADQRGRLVPDGRHPGGARGPGTARRTTGRDDPTDAGMSRVISEQGRARGWNRSRRADRCAAVSNMDSVRTYRELLGGEPRKKIPAEEGYEPACSGVVLYLGLNGATIIGCTTISSSPRPRGRVRLRSTAGRAGARPHLLSGGAGLAPKPAWRRTAARRFMCWSIRPYLRRSGLERCSPRTAGDPRQAEAPRRHGGYRGSHRRRTQPDAAGHPRPLPRAERRDLWAGQPWSFFGAFKPGNRSLMKGLYLAGGAAHPGPGCRW